MGELNIGLGDVNGGIKEINDGLIIVKDKMGNKDLNSFVNV